MRYLKYFENKEIDWEENWDWEEEDPDLNQILTGKQISYYEQFIGRTVRIIPDTRYYTSHLYDPKDTDGVIKRIVNLNDMVTSKMKNGRFECFEVKWTTGHINQYGIDDIYLV